MQVPLPVSFIYPPSPPPRTPFHTPPPFLDLWRRGLLALKAEQKRGHFSSSLRGEIASSLLYFIFFPSHIHYREDCIMAQYSIHTAKNQYQKFETNISRKGIARPQFQLPHSCAYIPTIDLPQCLFCCRKYVNQSWEYINRSQTHEYGIGTETAQFPEKEYINDFRCSAWKNSSTHF